MFSTLKYINAPNFENFRKFWNAQFLDGFIVHSKAFDGLNGDFPIGFLIWNTNQKSTKKTPITEISVQVIDKDTKPIGEKCFYNISNSLYLNAWIKKPKTNENLALPLSNAIKISSNPRKKTSCDDMVGYLYASNNDLQHAGQETLIASSIFTGGNGGGSYITPDNLWQAAIVFAVRRLIKPTWINNRDQFLQPSVSLPEEFKRDCLIWMLFNGSNLTASADGLEWNGRQWSIVNHFIPFTEDEVNAPDRFESDFMVRYLASLSFVIATASGARREANQLMVTEESGLPRAFGARKDGAGNPYGLSPEANAVLDAGRTLWRTYFAETPPFIVRDELKLNRADVGWYQIRNALKRRNETGDSVPVDFSVFEGAYRELGDKLRPSVYEYGFLKP